MSCRRKRSGCAAPLGKQRCVLADGKNPQTCLCSAHKEHTHSNEGRCLARVCERAPRGACFGAVSTGPCQAWVGGWAGHSFGILVETPLFSTVQVQLEDRECVFVSLCCENNVGGMKSRFGAPWETGLGACGQQGLH